MGDLMNPTSPVFPIVVTLFGIIFFGGFVALLYVVQQRLQTADQTTPGQPKAERVRANPPTTRRKTDPVLDEGVAPGSGRPYLTLPAMLTKPMTAEPVLPPLQVPGLQQTLSVLHERTSQPYSFPLGWSKDELVAGQLVRGINHMLITGISDIGKDGLARVIMLALAANQSPEQVQFCIIDGKGLDFAAWEGKAHTAHLALDFEDIPGAMRWVTQERRRRKEILRAAGVTKWEDYQGSGLPLLVVYIAELALLEQAVGASALAQWMNAELASLRGFGGRVIVATQNASKFDTRWRSQISLHMAGFQPAASQDQPNTGLTTEEIRVAGGVPPSELPAPPTGAGIFTRIYNRSAVIVRVPYLPPEEISQWLACFPERPMAAQADLLRDLGLPDGEATMPELPALAAEESEAAPAMPSLTERHLQVAAILAVRPDIKTRELARILYPGTDGGGSYSTATKRLVGQVQPLVVTSVAAVTPVTMLPEAEQAQEEHLGLNNNR